MTFLRPSTWPEALEARAADPALLPIAGGTDLMVDFNFDRRDPSPMLDLRGIADLHQWWHEDGQLRIGAGVPYTQIINDLSPIAPALAMAARTVASPQVRNRGTVGGNLATASPAGDSAPPLLAADAQVEVRSAHRTRIVPVREFFAGVKRSVLDPDELIAAVWIDASARAEQFSKIGPRNAMVISVVGLALSLNPSTGRVGTGMGSVGPTPQRADAAETFLAGELDSGDYWHSKADLPASLVTEFAQQISSAASPIDDVRGTAPYRRSVLKVLARRTLSWAWTDYQKGLPACA